MSGVSKGECTPRVNLPAMRVRPGWRRAPQSPNIVATSQPEPGPMPSTITIIMYHYVRDFARTRFPGIKGLDRAAFIRQLDHLCARFTILRIDEVIAALRAGAALPADAALLTFDDGYREHYDLVFPLLFDRGLQGSFFAPVAPVRDAVLLDVNRVHFILACCPDVARLGAIIDDRLEAGRAALGLPGAATFRAEWARPNRFDDAETIYVKRMLQTALPEALRSTIARDLFARFVTADEAAFAAELYLDRDQARLMQSCGMYFGSHGTSHVWLNRISREDQLAEIDGSLGFLRDIGSPVDDFWVMCYPFGGWDESLLSVLRARGCALGLTTEVAAADLSRHDPLLLPRFDTNDFPR